MAERDVLVSEELETWQQEVDLEGNQRFNSYEEYEDHYCRLVDDLLEESKQKFKPIKERWMEADKRLELDKLFSTTPGLAGPTRTDIALIPQAIEKSISQLLESLPRPQASPRQAGQEDMVGALNYFMSECMDQNNFDLLMARIALDMKRFNLGVIKQTFDENKTGPFGLPGKVVFSKTDPRYVWPDAFAKSWRWDDMQYLIVTEPMDLADVRLTFPDNGRKVKAENTYSLKRGEAEAGDSDDDLDSSATNRSTGDKVGERSRVLIKELWLKDKQQVFVPQRSEDDEPLTAEDGTYIGEWKLKYPNGRLIITAGKTILLDVPNPFAHGQPPYTFFQNRLSTRLFSFGDVELLIRLEDKLNTLHKDMLRNARVNINAPWIVDHGAFESPNQYKALTNEEGLVIIKAPGSTVMRQTPAELPASLFTILDWVKSMFNELSGVSDIQQGQLEKGSQLSADAIAGLQGAAAGNLRIKARLFENALEHLGHLLQWNIRQKYDSPMVVEVMNPSSGEKQQLAWQPAAMVDEFAVEIQAGSSLPGAKAGNMQTAITLFDKNLIDRPAALDLIQLPGRGVIVKRMQDRATELAKLGIDASSMEGPKKQQGRQFKKYPA